MSEKRLRKAQEDLEGFKAKTRLDKDLLLGVLRRSSKPKEARNR